ncbi:MAG: M24 family metallopeptidase [Oculatellaceae cyanobacterium Prado106]|jgi:Xaa-Pro aminopeptidase|nr:M24 family metallopeptidase [Oculatellaceae cyanobacterium Prado106]
METLQDRASTQSSQQINQRSFEIADKIALMRQALRETGTDAIRLQGTDWFSWATAGASHTVLLAAETGVAEILVTREGAWIMTSEIEAPRFQEEELTSYNGSLGAYQLFVYPWAEEAQRDAWIQEVTSNGFILSDRPPYPSAALPASLIQQKQILIPNELDRYRQVGRLASEAMTEVLASAKPDWTEAQLAGAGAAALWRRGLHPALTLAAGEKRLPRYRHPIPTQEPLGRMAMLVFCARGYGLYANLTRFVCFGSLSTAEANLHNQVYIIEADLLDRCRPGARLDELYGAIAQAYQDSGYPHAIQEHHQGGLTGYLSREVVATPTTRDILHPNMALAWNPSLPGAKVEDTFAIAPDAPLENLTFDPNWPSTEIAGRLRPLPLELG